MAARDIENFVIVFQDPLTTPVADQTKTRISRNISYTQSVNSNIQTLSVHDADSSGLISGLLYVPDLDPSDPCANNPHVPSNATQQSNLPDTDFNLIALAPWFNHTCTLSYLRSTRYDPIRAFIFYLPDGSLTLPPVSSDPTWDLGDNDAWKGRAHFPVYAIPGAIGAQFMTALSQYSGNVTAVPDGRQLIELGVYPSEYVRVYTEIGVSTAVGAPGLWQFMLATIGVLLVVLLTTSLAMHGIQFQRRKELQTKIKRGEVSLESLGMRRLTVPKDYIESMPLFVYVDYSTSQHEEKTRESYETEYEDEVGTSTDPSTIYKIKHHLETPSDARRSSLHSSSDLDYSYTLQHQPTCTICFEDFHTAISVVRETPCGHIFHPECIDTFLSEISSLCPICKQSCSPPGLCPVPIEDWMVRRERATRHLQRRVIMTEATNQQPTRTYNGYADIEGGVQDTDWGLLQGRGVLKMPGMVEVSNQQRYEPLSGEDLDEHFEREFVLGREERLSRQDMARKRGVEFTFRLPPVSTGDRRPAWRRSLSRVFPT